MKSHSADPFLLRAVEHWLDSSNELTYQPLFCFWLSTQGYSVKYAIKNTSFEQGKDVVAVDSKGKVHAYQLKGGDINLDRWRNEVRPEIEVLIDIPVKHPEINAEQGHLSYLVVNGNIEDAARIEITDLNNSRWKITPLHIITKGDLLVGFQNLSNGILPKNVDQYKKLIDFMFSNGQGVPDITKVSEFIYEILDIHSQELSKAQSKRNIAAAILYASMIIGSYRLAGNHTAVVQVMTILGAAIIFLSEKFHLDDKYWKGSFDIVMEDILNSAKQLEKEINEKGFDSQINSPFEKVVLPYRSFAAISVIYPLKLSEFLAGDKNWETMYNPDLSNRYAGANSIWSESSFVPSICIANIFSHLPNCKQLTKDLIEGAIETILLFNGRNAKLKPGLPTPYYQLTSVVEKLTGVDSTPFEENFIQRSYYLSGLIDILVRVEDKLFLQKNWREISFIHLEEFVPETKVDYLLWNNKTGINKTTIIPKQKKWGEMTEEAKLFTGQSLPDNLKRFPNFIPFFICVFPHRVNREIIGYLSNLIPTPLNKIS